jgi:formate/nitrite transporter FocA (FNT family)
VQLQGGVVNESWYFQLATEIGVFGALLFITSLVLATAGAFRGYLTVHNLWLRVLTLTTGGAGVGFLFVGAVLHVWDVALLSSTVWLLAGISVRAAKLDQTWLSQVGAFRLADTTQPSSAVK